MKHWMFFLLLSTLATSVLANNKAALEESLYYQYQKSILSSEKSVSKSFQAFSKFEQVLYLNALEDLVLEGNETALSALDEIDPFYYELSEQLRLGLLRIKNRRTRRLPADVLARVENALRSGSFDLKIIYLLAANEAELKRVGYNSLLNLAKNYSEFFELNNTKRVASDVALRDLFYSSPDLNQVLNGSYANGVKLYMFCRTNRLYPCLMVMRDSRGDIVRNNNDGSIWTHKALASAKTGLPSYNRNGNTPTGVMTIDSVMPTADQAISFGKYRRLILNFIPKTQNDSLLQTLLPDSSKNEEWWKAGAVARDMDRDLLRIHGSGKYNPDELSSFWPFLQTSGCIAQRENTYGDVTFKDQRVLLDVMMKAMDLTPVYSNETRIKGIFYITEIDSQNAPVTAQDLHEKGIQ